MYDMRCSLLRFCLLLVDKCKSLSHQLVDSSRRVEERSIACHSTAHRRIAHVDVDVGIGSHSRVYVGEKKRATVCSVGRVVSTCLFKCMGRYVLLHVEAEVLVACAALSWFLSSVCGLVACNAHELRAPRLLLQLH